MDFIISRYSIYCIIIILFAKFGWIIGGKENFGDFDMWLVSYDLLQL